MPQEEREISFSEFFNERLKDRNLSLKKLSELSGIAVRHLENISAGNFHELPSSPYARGYLQRLAPILGFDADAWWEKIKKAEGMKNSGERDALPENRFAKKIPKKAIALAAVGILIAIYVALRFSQIAGEPRILVTYPEKNPATVDVQTIEIKGIVRNGDALTVNGGAVPIGSDGTWSVPLLLDPGLNTVEISAKKLLGKETRFIEQILYEPSAVAPTSTASSTNPASQMPPPAP